ncbi:hypothetical protein Cob_v011155 [Colletotrichum orbiculare MAFF 240422]|uniref:Uncharacterized protein n=1 Tax=Colletotrichum orbiculare (strain 104-T / ATCC 96160 / CBS 514.97 / LARS 414 / MAFF 240422) TaxID=1213857 RepID=A0A484FBP8_COLOR|nr:hypothetical protein Cob_v011155 [Colletotrichum orbiculare MAFF 240422]
MMFSSAFHPYVERADCVKQQWRHRLRLAPHVPIGNQSPSRITAPTSFSNYLFVQVVFQSSTSAMRSPGPNARTLNRWRRRLVRHFPADQRGRRHLSLAGCYLKMRKDAQQPWLSNLSVMPSVTTQSFGSDNVGDPISNSSSAVSDHDGPKQLCKIHFPNAKTAK